MIQLVQKNAVSLKILKSQLSQVIRFWNTGYNVSRCASKQQRMEIKTPYSNKPDAEMNLLDFVEIFHYLPYYMADALPVFMR